MGLSVGMVTIDCAEPQKLAEFCVGEHPEI
jgi:hypothetical protein